jgi:hypothetical protein
MPDRTIEQRVAELEERVGMPEQEWQNIPNLIEARLRLTDSRVARLSSEMRELRSEVRGLAGEVRAFPRAVAEMLAEQDKK